MTLYEIDNAILDLLQPDENGEISEDTFEALNELQMEREKKVENIALAYKNTQAEADAIKAEETKLKERRQSLDKQAERLKEYLLYALNGETLKTPRVAVTYRKSESIEVDEGIFLPDDLLRYSEPQPDKTKIKMALKDGRKLIGVRVVEKQNVQVK